MSKDSLEKLNFSKYNSEKVNQVIRQHLKLITEEILNFKDRLGLVSIILTGGFGRGEGSVLIKDRVVKPVNDYDISIIVKKHAPFLKNVPDPRVFGIISQISSKIKNKIQSAGVDIDILLYDQLPYSENSIKNFEKRFGSQVIWGLDAIGLLPEYDPKEIPLSDGVKLLFNRMTCLINGFPQANINRPNFSIQQSVKALHACCEALLLISGNYSYSYEERGRRFKLIFPNEFPDLSKNFPKLLEYIEKSIKFKLFPDYEIFAGYRELWPTVVDMYFEVLKYYIGKTYALGDSDLESIVNCVLNNLRGKLSENIIYWGGYLLNMWAHKIRVLKCDLSCKPKIYLYASESFLLYLMRYGYNQEYIELARSYLNRIIDVTDKDDLLELRIKTIKAFGSGAYEA
jgi:hypothetical protein